MNVDDFSLEVDIAEVNEKLTVRVCIKKIMKVFESKTELLAIKKAIRIIYTQLTYVLKGYKIYAIKNNDFFIAHEIPFNVRSQSARNRSIKAAKKKMYKERRGQPRGKYKPREKKVKEVKEVLKCERCGCDEFTTTEDIEGYNLLMCVGCGHVQLDESEE